MNTKVMSDELYDSLIYTKEELELEYKIFRQSTIVPSKINDYINYVTINNHLYNLIKNYDILKKCKSDSLINYEKRLEII